MNSNKEKITKADQNHTNKALYSSYTNKSKPHSTTQERIKELEDNKTIKKFNHLAVE
jgi:hypothetical protein